MENSLVSQEHPDDELWEEYAFGRLKPEAEAAAEEHLLLCGECQDKLARTDEAIRLIKFAIKLHHARRRSFFRLITRPACSKTKTAMLAGVAVAGLMAVLWNISPKPHPEPVGVTLKSFRGGAEAVMNHAPAKHPLDLTIRSVEILPSASYRLEVVSQAGETVWSGPADPRGGALSAHVPKRLAGGGYWVRLYAQRSNELLAEYGLHVQ